MQLLVDAVRSRDEGRFRDTIEYLRLPNGGVAGERKRELKAQAVEKRRAASSTGLR